MGAPELVEVELERIVCGRCGIVFAMPTHHVDALRNSHETFYCPNGHPRHYPGESDVERLQRELKETQRFLESAKKRTEWAEQDAKRAKERAETEKRRSAAYRGQLTRVKNGVCPCCRRNFSDLRRHMKTKHPDYQSEK